MKTFLAFSVNFLTKYRFLLLNLLVTLATVLALSIIILNLQVMEQHRSRLYKTLALGVGKTVVDYIQHKDDFQTRKAIIYLTISVTAFLFIGILISFYFLAKLYQRLSQEGKTKSKMISTITHNARHYLGVIRSRLDLLVLKTERGQVVQNAGKEFGLMMENVVSLNHLIDNLNDNEILNEGKIRLASKALNLHQALRQVVSHFENNLAEKKIQVVCNLALADIWVWADFRLLEQVMMNLWHNAIKFSPSPSVITLSSSQGKNIARVFLQDQGPGIDKKDWQKIFDPFVRLIPTTRGAGLGLANARQFVRLMGGELSVLASELNQGTTFVLQLPLGPPPHTKVKNE